MFEHAFDDGEPFNGKEFTIYASQGPLLIRVTGVSPSGIPFGNVMDVTQAVLAAQQIPLQTVVVQHQSELALPSSAYLPAAPAVNYAECFSVFTEGSYAYGDVVAALLPTGLRQSQFDALAWQDGAYRVFSCANPPFGRASQSDVVIHRFGDTQSAQQALPYLSDTYAPEVNEMRSCDTVDSLVVCVTGRSLTGSPLSDVHFVLQDVVAAAGG